MVRKLHSLLGLIAAVLALVLGLTGAILSLDPALERVAATVPAHGQISVAALAGRVAQHYPQAEQIQRTPSGAVIVYYSRDGKAGIDRVDSLTGQGIAPYAPSAFSRWLKNLHRSLLLDTPGRAASGLTALAMLVLSVSGRPLARRPEPALACAGWPSGRRRLVAVCADRALHVGGYLQLYL